MAGCCSADYRRMFSRRAAGRDARLFRTRGLTGTARTLTKLAGEVGGETVLDVGGGVGGIGLELLAAGAATATNVELSGAYEEAAAELAAERGVAQRVERRVADFVADGDAILPHDVVVLHRVVCCYPDADALMAAAAAHTQRVLLLTYPQERWWIRRGTQLVNIFLRLRGCGFRTYAHPVARILGVAQERGLHVERRERDGLVWESAALLRS